MTPHTAVALAIVATAGCSSAAPRDGSLPLADGGFQTVPAQCRVETASDLPAAPSQPYAVTFRFRNDGATPLVYHQGCWMGFEVSSCASGYADQLANRVFCPCACTPEPSCPVCGGCAGGAAELAPGAKIDAAWTAAVGVLSKRPKGECYEWPALPSGRYRVRFPIYPSVEAAVAQSAPSRVVETDFTLPHPGGVVDVPLAP